MRAFSAGAVAWAACALAGAAGCGAHGAPWGYGDGPNDALGPSRWAGLSPRYAACGQPSGQSPIALDGPPASPPPPPRFDYRPAAATLVDDGHGLVIRLGHAGTLRLGDDRFTLTEIDVHRPSEHSVDGARAALELELLHRGPRGLAVVSLFVVGGDDNPPLARLWTRLPARPGDQRRAGTLDVGAILPDERAYDAYVGSLTTPPCTPGVRWIVLRNPIALPVSALDALAARWPESARPTQPAPPPAR